MSSFSPEKAAGLVERTWTINGQHRSVSFSPLARLLNVLRDQLGLLSLKEGCGEGECGACSVMLQGELHLACLVAAAQVEDRTEILTAEGLCALEQGRMIKEAFDETGAVQCGYCTPGMLLSSLALLQEHARPTEEQIRAGLAGQLCRCTGYTKIIAAVQAAASVLPAKEER